MESKIISYFFPVLEFFGSYVLIDLNEKNSLWLGINAKEMAIDNM